MATLQDDLLSDLPRGAPPRTLKDFRTPESAFTAPDTIRRTDSLAYRKGRLFLGVIGGETLRDDKGRRYVAGGHAVGLDDDRHICTFAGSRAGKGRACIVPNMLHYPGSVLATDPKGELATMTARRRVELGQKVHVLDPFGVTEGYPRREGLATGFNPIMAMRSGRILEDAALIGDALVVVGGKDPHWDESARAFIEGVVLHVATYEDYDGRRSLLTVQELVAKGAQDPAAAGGFSMEALKVEMLDNDIRATAGVVQAAASNFFERPQNERGSVLSSARRHLKFIDLFRDPERPDGRMTLEKDGFRLEQLKTEPTTVYLCLPARHIGTCNRWLRLFVNLTLQSMEQTRAKALPGGAPVLCVLDEFATLGHLKQIEDAAGQIAGFGVKLWPVLQDLGQLKALYENRWETFLGNSGIVQFFGNNDLTTLEWISKRCGRTSIQTMRKSDVTEQASRTGAKGESSGIEVHDLLTVDEAARFFGRDDPKLRQLVVWAGSSLPLLVLQRAYYDKHILFAGMADDPPGAA